MPDSRFHPRGHTLVELVTAMTASAMLLAGLGSVMLIASRVADVPTISTERLEAASAVNQFADDVRYATFFVSRSTGALDFVVADRDSDGTAERIRYEWSGVPGDPLQRTVNGGTPVNLVDSVQDFQISLNTTSQTASYTTAGETSESILASYTASTSGSTRDMNQNDFSAQRINPAGFSGVPANATAWNATRVDFQGKRMGSGETLRVQLRSSGDPNDRPTGEILGEKNILEDYLSLNTDWNSVTFASPIRGLALHRKYSLVWGGTAGESGNAGSLATDDYASTSVHESTDAGANWTYKPNRRTFYRLYGTYSVPGTTYNVIRNYAARVNVVLQAGDSAISRINASIPLQNLPELLSAYWRTDFDTNPTTDDVTRDGTSDWAVSSGTFNPATVSGGFWFASGGLESRPKNDFATVTTVDVRCRNTGVGGNGAVVRINADRQAGATRP